MAETPEQRQIHLTAVGIYAVIFLALLRFLIYPLHASIQEKKALLGEWSESYRLKSRVLEKQRESQQDTVVEKSVLLPNLFDKGVSTSFIQADVLEWITKLAEKKGLTILNFEMLEPIAGKNVSEVPIMVRLKGMSGAFIEVLEAIEKGERTLSIRSMQISKSGQDQLFSLTLSAYRLDR